MKAYRITQGDGSGGFTLLAEDDTAMFDRLSRLADIVSPADRGVIAYMRQYGYAIKIVPQGDVV